jgi:hypothetical protein
VGMLAEAQARMFGGTDRYLIPKLDCRFPAPIAALLLAWTMTMSGVFSSGAQSLRQEGQINFNISAQPLSRALMAYAAATGLEIFYNAVLAEKQRSVALVGRLAPSDALQILLRDTGYVAKPTMPGAFTIVPAPRPSSLSTIADASARRHFEPFFAAIQARIGDTLCRNGELLSAPGELLFQFWLAPSGVVARAQVIDEKGEPADDQTLAIALRGLVLASPPAGMPQPVNMVIFPPSGVSKSCGRVEARRSVE